MTNNGIEDRVASAHASDKQKREKTVNWQSHKEIRAHAEQFGLWWSRSFINDPSCIMLLQGGVSATLAPCTDCASSSGTTTPHCLNGAINRFAGQHDFLRITGFEWIWYCLWKAGMTLVLIRCCKGSLQLVHVLLSRSVFVSWMVQRSWTYWSLETWDK